MLPVAAALWKTTEKISGEEAVPEKLCPFVYFYDGGLSDPDCFTCAVLMGSCPLSPEIESE